MDLTTVFFFCYSDGVFRRRRGEVARQSGPACFNCFANTANPTRCCARSRISYASHIPIHFFHIFISIPFHFKIVAVHHQGIIHRDIKPANLLWTEDRRQVKIGDFGVSHFSYAQRLAAAGGKDINDDPYDPILLDESGLTRRAGTPSFLAPEVISEHVNESASLFSSTSQSPSSDSPATFTTLTSSPTAPTAATSERPQITKSIDIWALGVTLYCLLFGGTPFHPAQTLTATGSEFSLYNAICNGDWDVPKTMGYDRIPTGGRYPNPSSEGASIINLLDRFLQKDYHVRITLDDVKVSFIMLHSFLLSFLIWVALAAESHFIFLVYFIYVSI